jgi:ABC-type nitrate/sulfonate/bicarbonate transport system substrate-binding protein
MQAEEGLGAYLIGQHGVTCVEDLRGKLLAGDPGDSNLDLIRMKILRDHGLTEDDYRVDIIGNTPERTKAFLAGKVDSAILTPPSADKVVGRWRRIAGNSRGLRAQLAAGVRLGVEKLGRR